MSPERLTNVPNSDAPAADIYAFAMVMVKCITAKLVLPHDHKYGHKNVQQRRISNSNEDCPNTEWIIRIFDGNRPELPIGTRDLDTYVTNIKECWDGDPTQRPSSDV
eukprot:1305013-Amphidinium_carterae.1